MLNIGIAVKKREKAGRGIRNIQYNDVGVTISDRMASENLGAWWCLNQDLKEVTEKTRVHGGTVLGWKNSNCKSPEAGAYLGVKDTAGRIVSGVAWKGETSQRMRWERRRGVAFSVWALWYVRGLDPRPTCGIISGPVSSLLKSRQKTKMIL